MAPTKKIPTNSSTADLSPPPIELPDANFPTAEDTQLPDLAPLAGPASSSSSVNEDAAGPAPGLMSPVQVTLVREEAKIIEMEMLTSFDKIKDHFYKFYPKIGRGFYADYIESTIRDVLDLKFDLWVSEFNPQVTTTFATTGKEVMKEFIDHYLKSLSQDSQTSRAIDDETDLRNALMALKLHHFFDHTSKTWRWQDLTKMHVNAFMSQVVLIYRRYNRDNASKSFPVSSQQTYRDVIDAWLDEMSTSAPLVTRVFFESLAADLREKYLKNGNSYVDTNGCLRSFMDDIYKQITVVESTMQAMNKVLSTHTIHTMLLVFDVIPAKQLNELISSTIAAKKQGPNAPLPNKEIQDFLEAAVSSKRTSEDSLVAPPSKRLVPDKPANQRVTADKPRSLSRCHQCNRCLLYTSPSPRDTERSRMPSSA